MSHPLDRLLYFRKNADTFAGGHEVRAREDRTWEDDYRLPAWQGCLTGISREQTSASQTPEQFFYPPHDLQNSGD